MPAIERKDPAHGISFGENDQRRIGQAEIEIGIFLDDRNRPLDIGCLERFELENAARNLATRARSRLSSSGR